jgi:hypothetical protein
VTAPLKAEVRARFRPDASQGALSIENDPGAFFGADIHLLLFGEAQTVIADIGTIVIGGTRFVDIPGGILQASGSDTASLPKLPAGTAPELTVLFAFNSKGQPISASAWTDGQTVRLNAVAHAAVKYGPYKARARMLTYSPVVESIATSQAGLAGKKVTYGVIAAFAPPGTLVIHQIEPQNIVNGNDEIEIYRIFSYTVTTRDGEFEFPPGFPNDLTYPGIGFSIDPSLIAKNERTHETGFMDSSGRAWTKELFCQNLEPYVGALSYKPKKFIRESPVPKDTYSKELVAKALDIIAARGRMKL